MRTLEQMYIDQATEFNTPIEDRSNVSDLWDSLTLEEQKAYKSASDAYCAARLGYERGNNEAPNRADYKLFADHPDLRYSWHG